MDFESMDDPIIERAGEIDEVEPQPEPDESEERQDYKPTMTLEQYRQKYGDRQDDNPNL